MIRSRLAQSSIPPLLAALLLCLATMPAMALDVQTLSLAVGAGGSVRSQPEGLHCGRQCAALFPAGTVVELRAEPAAGYVFDGYSGACSGLVCRLELHAPQQVEARFRPLALIPAKAGAPGIAPVTASAVPQARLQAFASALPGRVMGATRSQRDDGLLWLSLDDGRLLALGDSGQVRGSLSVPGAGGGDLASLRLRGQPQLLLPAAAGGWLLVEEPKISDYPEGFALQRVGRSQARGLNGAVAADEGGSAWLLDASGALLRWSLSAPAAGAERMGKARGVYELPLAFDFSADDAVAVVSTLSETLIYRRAGGATWAEALAREPERLGADGCAARAAAAFSRGSRNQLQVISTAPALWRIELPPAP